MNFKDWSQCSLDCVKKVLSCTEVLTSIVMAYVGLPCGTEEWAEQKNVFFMLSHLRSLDDLELFMESYTRPDAAPSATSKCLSSLRGLVVFLTENCGTEDQSKFLKKTLPFIAKSAALLEQRVPLSGMPLLEKQESK